MKLISNNWACMSITYGTECGCPYVSETRYGRLRLAWFLYDRTGGLFS